jgi:hypothetical protein
MMLFASKSRVYEDLLRFYRSETLHLGNRRLEGGSVVGVAVVSFNPHNPIGITGGHQGDFTTEFIALVDFTFSDAFYFWSVNAVTLVRTLSLLSMNLLSTFNERL